MPGLTRSWRRRKRLDQVSPAAVAASSPAPAAPRCAASGLDPASQRQAGIDAVDPNLCHMRNEGTFLLWGTRGHSYVVLTHAVGRGSPKPC